MAEQMVIGYILTGGKNSRMQGQIKLYLACGEERFADRLLRAMDPMEEIWLSVSSEQPFAALGLPMVADRYPETGPMGGILSGLETLEEKNCLSREEGSSALLVLPSDTPFVTEEDVHALLAAYEENPVLTIGRAGGRLQPLLGVYPHSAAETIRELIRSENYRLRQLIDRLPCQIVELSEGAGININRPEEHAEYCRKTKCS